jgi:inward rectifier potassium channel
MAPEDPLEATPKADAEDLGFGTRVRTGRGERLLNRDGSFTVRRHGLPLRAVVSLSHTLLSMRWPGFLALVVLTYLLFNGAFALVYLALGEDAIQGPGAGFERAFFFSVQTASTIGYGHIVPVTTAANVTTTLEALLALIAFALVTGLVYARFTRPMADIVFSKQAIIAPYRGITAFEFRIANQRRNQIIELQARVFLSRVDRLDGRVTRSFHELELERDHVAFFPLTWTVVHPIDEGSPFHGLNREQLLACDAEIMILLSGVDDTVSQTVHARSSYKADEVAWNTRFANIYQRAESGNPTSIDIARLDDIESLS